MFTILKSKHNSHHFLVFLLLTSSSKMFIWIASSDYDTISIYIDFFQTIKRCCQVHVQVTSLFKKISIGMLKKKQFFVTFKVCLYEKQLGSLERDIPFTEMCCVYVKSLLFSFCVYMIKGDDALTEISTFEARWDEQKSI